jgi:hypothetical protein
LFFIKIADIFNNLHAKYTKGSIVKALDQLVKDDSVISKVYGKTSIYSIKQSSDNAPTEEEINALQKSLNELTEKHEELSSENKKLDQCKLLKNLINGFSINALSTI